MNQIKAAVDDLIEETRLRNLNDEQIEWRLRKFTEVCEKTIKNRVDNIQKRQMLIERLEILKCFYDHSSVKHYGGALSIREADERERNKRLQNIVRRRRMALEMIERTDPEVAQEIVENLEEIFSKSVPLPRTNVKTPRLEPELRDSPRLSAHHWYFLYFNLFLLACLIYAILTVIR
ncbi:MAG TPA: hypothetical protein VM123_02965 [archaeon]|nr:hypothetical protein [archaeon]